MLIYSYFTDINELSFELKYKADGKILSWNLIFYTIHENKVGNFTYVILKPSLKKFIFDG